MPPVVAFPYDGQPQEQYDKAFDTLARHLAEEGWCVLHRYLAPALLEALDQRLDHLLAQDALTAAGIGRGADNQDDERIRRDITRWLEKKDATENAFLERMETLRLELNRRLMLGLFFCEAHFALYEAGAYYARHTDSFRGARNRLVSSVLYLNRGWQPQDGGMLALYDEGESATPLVRIAPEWGTLVLFLSEEFPHEVEAARRPRRSIAGWFRCNDRGQAPALQAPAL